MDESVPGLQAMEPDTSESGKIVSADFFIPHFQSA
jgi:hypothetical protein